MSNKKAPRITRRDRIKAMPVDRHFTFEMTGLSMEKECFYQGAKLMHPHLKIIGKGAGRKYYITKKDKERLLRIETRTESQGLKRENKPPEPYELTKEDKLLNLFMRA